MFLDFLVTMLRETAVSLRSETADVTTDASDPDIEAFTNHLIADAERVSEALEDPSMGTFETMLLVLDTGFARDLYDARRLQTLIGDSIPSDAQAELDNTVEILENIGVARQYLKTLYFQRELADISRKILYVGIPALSLLLIGIWVYGGEGSTTIQGLGLELLVTLAGTLAFAPLAVFFVYVLRVATITRRTASHVPFTIREQSRL